jgi:hypothetical protein
MVIDRWSSRPSLRNMRSSSIPCGATASPINSMLGTETLALAAIAVWTEGEEAILQVQFVGAGGIDFPNDDPRKK